MSFQDPDFIHLDIYPDLGFLDHTVILFLISWGNPTVFHNGCTSLYIASNSAQGLPLFYILARILSLVFLIINILIDMRWYLIVVLISIFLITSIIEHLFMYLLAICMPLENAYQVICPFLNWVIYFCCWVVWVLYMFWIVTPIRYWFENILSHSIGAFAFGWWFTLLSRSF